jgi:hypothetical protein
MIRKKVVTGFPFSQQKQKTFAREVHAAIRPQVIAL